MIGQSFAEEIDCGNFFDQIDDLVDFPIEDIGIGFASDPKSFQSIWSTQPESLPGSDSVFSSKSNSDNSAELYVPFEEIVQLDWLSSFEDNSFSGGTLSLTTDKKEDSSSAHNDSSSSHSQFRTSSPVSVLESSGSSSPTGITLAITGKRGRPRTKRPSTAPSSADEKEEKEKDKVTLPSAAESQLMIRVPKHVLSEDKRYKKKPKISQPVLDGEPLENQDSSPGQQQPVRKCMHCEVTKTPQWRLGPMGPKTLCNACGVRYKSGRLFPEYRPAASPTFMPSLHSNSHKKVAEMRSKKCETGFEGEAETSMSDLPELIPNRAHPLIDYA